MKACLIRHGETAWTLTGQHTGLTDLALTPHGERQSRDLGPRLQSMGITRVLVSPRLRAQQTCDLAGLGVASEVEPDLAEWDYGDFEGRCSVDIRCETPGWDIWRDGCPGGESTADIAGRADRLLARLATMKGLVALFSHGQFGAALAVRWIGLELIEGQHFPLHPASVSLLGTNHHPADRRVIELWNESPRALPSGTKPLPGLSRLSPPVWTGHMVDRCADTWWTDFAAQLSPLAGLSREACGA